MCDAFGVRTEGRRGDLEPEGARSMRQRPIMKFRPDLEQCEEKQLLSAGGVGGSRLTPRPSPAAHGPRPPAIAGSGPALDTSHSA